MLNLAGSSYDLGSVLFAVLQDAEHRRRSVSDEEAEEKLLEHARRKLDEIEESYRESGGTKGYWQELEREVLETAMPQYVAWAIAQNRLERNQYHVWRGGDPLARVAFGVGGLLLGAGLIALKLPFLVDTLGLGLALGGLSYPDLTRLVHDYRHTRRLNRLVTEAERYQKDQRIHYVSNAKLEEELRSVGGEREPEPPAGPPRRREGVEVASGGERPRQGRGRERA